MDDLVSIIELHFSLNELQKIATRLDKVFRINNFWNGWIELEKEIFGKLDVNLDYIKSHYHYSEIYNLIIMKYGKTERLVKYYLTKQFVKNEDEICLFEFNVGNSRLDFGRINGNSYAYEIKTELDNTNRLLDQIYDYISVFEFVNVVIHQKHLKKIRSIIPRKVGIIVYKFTDGEIIFEYIRKPKENNNIKKIMQLELLNSNDLNFIIKNIIKSEEVPKYKYERLKMVKNQFKNEEFNEIFKQTIKNKQSKKWNYIKNNFDTIKPIELQDTYIYARK